MTHPRLSVTPARGLRTRPPSPGKFHPKSNSRLNILSRGTGAMQPGGKRTRTQQEVARDEAYLSLVSHVDEEVYRRWSRDHGRHGNESNREYFRVLGPEQIYSGVGIQDGFVGR